MRGEPRRQQRRQHPAGGQALRSRVQGAQRARGATESAAAAPDRVLAVQPLPRPGRHRRAQLPPQRSGHRATSGLRRGVPQELQRHRAALRAGRRLHARRRATRPVPATGHVARRVMEGACRRGRLRAHADVAGARRSRIAARLRRRGAGEPRPLGRTGRRPGGGRRAGVRPVAAQAPVPAAPRDPDLGAGLQRRADAAAASAGRVLPPPAGGRPDGSRLVDRPRRQEPDGPVRRARRRHGDERGAAPRHAGLRRRARGDRGVAGRPARRPGALGRRAPDRAKPGDASGAGVADRRRHADAESCRKPAHDGIGRPVFLALERPAGRASCRRASFMRSWAPSTPRCRA